MPRFAANLTVLFGESPPGRHGPGTGEIDYRFLFRHLDRIGYRGLAGCEDQPLAGTEAGLGWMKELT